MVLCFGKGFFAFVVSALGILFVPESIRNAARPFIPSGPQIELGVEMGNLTEKTMQNAMKPYVKSRYQLSYYFCIYYIYNNQ